MIRVVGDCHGNTKELRNIIEDSEFPVLQIGDLGFNYDDLNGISKKDFAWFPGNHDNYDILESQPNFLGHYGLEKLGGVEFYYIRGAFSPDKGYRVAAEMKGKGKSWWKEEEIGYKEFINAVYDYESHRPNIMITHTCPKSIAQKIGNPNALKMFGFDPDTFTTITQDGLQTCFDLHKPKLWIFGHFHQDLDFYDGGTRFICLPEMGWVDIHADGEISIG